MKRIILLIILIGACSCAHASETNPTILWDFGNFRVNIPFKTINGVGLWDFVGKRGMAGAETPIAEYKRFQFVAGGITSLDGQGTPFFGANLLLINPAENFIPLSSFRPGLFGGRDFRNRSWVFGLKASIGLF